MSRNLKVSYIKKLLETEAPNGYKFDVANYLHNPALYYEYPSFIKLVAEDETTATYRRVYYFKYYDGTGEYLAEVFQRKKNGEEWQVVKKVSEEKLEQANRFNLNKLLSFCTG